MTSFSGAVAYLKYVSKTDKGDIHKGDVFNSVFGLGKTGEARTNFTSQVIVETVGSNGKVALTAMATEKFGEGKDAKVVAVDGTVSYKTAAEINAGGLEEGAKVAYFSEEFQMEHVPAQDIPTIGPKMERIPLVAEPRRIAVRYDQITAFQAKTDYGFSLDKQIAEQACGELAYEIDSEIVNMLYVGAQEGTSEAEAKELTFNKRARLGVSTFEHYNAFLEVIEKARSIIYKRTKKFHPNYMVIAADVLPVLRFVNGYTGVKTAKMNGPYKVGELDGMNIYVSPDLGDGEFFFGLNGNDMMSSAGVYAPYMAIVPTQLLGTPDGGLAQGFSTWYAKALLNASLLVAGKIVDEAYNA